MSAPRRPVAGSVGKVVARARSMVGELGGLRLALAVLSLLIILAAPLAGGRTSYEGWALLTTIVTPAMFVIVAFLLPLDMLMTLLFRADAADGERRRLNRVLVIETILFVVLIAAWYPFMNRLLSL